MLSNENDLPDVVSDNDEYEEVLLSVTFPELLPDSDKNMLLSKATIIISNLNTSTPSCNINGYEFSTLLGGN